MIDGKILTLLTQAGTFISAFAAIAAGIIMVNAQKHFGSGILAWGFKSIALGIFFIAGGITLDAVQNYIQIANSVTAATILVLIKETLFVVGTYIVVIGSKKTVDKLESLTK